MRKILLGTTAVVGAALIGAGAAQAQAPAPLPVLPAPIGVGSPGAGLQVRLGGFMLTQVTYNIDDLDRARRTPTGVGGAGRVARQRTDFKNEVELTVSVLGKMANGLQYGAVMELQNDGAGGTVFDTDEAYVFVTSPTLGTIRFGEEDAAANLIQIRPPSVTGHGVDGDWGSSLLSSAAFTGGGPSLILGVNDGNDSTKIVYLSPQFFGFDFGVSYSPNRNEGDRVIAGRALDSLGIAGGGPISPTSPQRDGTGLTNELSGGVRYRGTFNNISVGLSFVAQTADAPKVGADGTPLTTRLRNPTAYSVGASISGFGFTLGGEYTWGRYSGAPATAGLAAGRDQSKHYGIGLTYVIGAWAFGGFFGQAEQDNGRGVADREQTVYGLGVSYKLAPGFDIYANWGHLKDENVNISLGATAARPAGTLRNRDADAFLLGTRIAF